MYDSIAKHPSTHAICLRADAYDLDENRHAIERGKNEKSVKNIFLLLKQEMLFSEAIFSAFRGKIIVLV